MLPPLLAEVLHHPHHTLYSVSASAPPPKAPSAASSPPPTAATSSPPTADEIHTAVPHPHAYYCKEHNGWVLLSWCSSSVLPPISPTFKPTYAFPDQTRRKRTSSCIGDEEHSVGRANVTHHFHKYEKAVDARMLTTPFKRNDDELDLLDLYLCCQCSVYCLVSPVIPGVLPLRVLEDFVRDKLEHPPLGKTGEIAVVTGFETVITILENRLWRGESRSLPVTRHKFQSKLGWNASVRRVFEVLDFKAEPIQNDGQRPTEDNSDFHGQHINASVEDATHMYQTGIGAHINQLAPGVLPEPLIGLPELEPCWQTLGMSPVSYSPELLAFAYFAQCRCDPKKTPDYFTAFAQIIEIMKNRGVPPPDSLDLMLAEEKSRHRFTWTDLDRAEVLLGFGKAGPLGVELADADEDFIIGAWKDAMKRVWGEPDAASARADLIEAFKVIADLCGSVRLQEAWEMGKGSGMAPDTAYSTLDVPRDVDETMLLAIYAMRVEDQPSQADRMREALTVIMEATDSERLRKFLETGRDPGDVTSETRLDMPRGLNQLGNTCYLNSLLQYFYTIKDLRDAVGPLSEKSLDMDKFTDDDLKRHRVGGRLVTRREIVRSKKFVHQLADLFRNLEYSDQAAVTPTLDLAKLALVTTQDEEEDDQGGAGTDTSNDTDATLVDDGTMRRSSPSPIRSPKTPPSPSVLGKRNRGRVPDVDMEGITTSEGEKDYVMVSKASTPPRESERSTPERKASSSKHKTTEKEDVVMKDSQERKPPPLPPRKAATTSDTGMMFGRQHDVSECMDNCMFQIETALLNFQDQGLSGSQSDKTSVIKRLFYGKKRQLLTPLTDADAKKQKSSTTHEKEDLFSHLHLNVSDESFDLYDGLGRYFDDIVELDGVKRRMEVTLVDLPPLLQIQLQRVQFDRETQQAYKSQAYVKFDETLCMDRFLDSADPEKRARTKDIQVKLNAARDRIQRFTQGKHAPYAPALGAAADFLSRQDTLQLPEATTELVSRLKDEQSHVTAQLERERGNASKLKQELEDLWKNDNEAQYELTSVFIHRGSSPSFGHYFFYSRNLPDHPDQWFKYNDSNVTLVSKDEVFGDTTGSTANPYMLVFARKNLDVIQTVHRFDTSSI
ncbi:uncharacterized protein PHACADRAFT_85514 [Phanerochaete carnosa HHB-10118-sp]|uniref:ubiquitinyl hydrolase 1 n=1 Tax=Phanerochaete carnosa (strain HHB-10118-sp) TaxID=650164 RepID=K5WPX8_PHACS|nr:uncharacterized protein PHACADRAFT_85514 [Phanerochaete carnosa HHB-10118-sp]EKM61525.1 hypothetical protein PHACADRAFT_85514 [Phanerochaete carnosa HHB-10118-sp]